MRRAVLVLLLVAAIASSAALAFAVDSVATPKQLTPQEQIEQWKREFEERVEASEEERTLVPSTTSDSEVAKTAAELRSQVQSLTAANAELESQIEQLTEEASRAAAAQTQYSTSVQDEMAAMEREIVRLEALVVEMRPTFWRDPADWAALVGGITLGVLIGVGISSRRRGSASIAEPTTEPNDTSEVAPPDGEPVPPQADAEAAQSGGE